MAKYSNQKQGFIFKGLKIPSFGVFEIKTAEEEKILQEILTFKDSWGKDIWVADKNLDNFTANEEVKKLIKQIEELQKENEVLKKSLSISQENLDNFTGNKKVK